MVSSVVPMRKMLAGEFRERQTFEFSEQYGSNARISDALYFMNQPIAPASTHETQSERKNPSQDSSTVRRQRLWDRCNAGLKESFCSS
jgi:hypothetical protein